MSISIGSCLLPTEIFGFIHYRNSKADWHDLGRSNTAPHPQEKNTDSQNSEAKAYGHQEQRDNFLQNKHQWTTPERRTTRMMVSARMWRSKPNDRWCR